MKVILEAHSAY